MAITPFVLLLQFSFICPYSDLSFIFCLGIPIGVSTHNIKLARELDLPQRLRINDWQVLRDGGKNRSRKYMALPFTTTNVSITGPEQVKKSIDKKGFSKTKDLF